MPVANILLQNINRTVKKSLQNVISPAPEKKCHHSIITSLKNYHYNKYD